ncbi:MAG: aspartate/glutamate racemase family protein [Reyranella sp.]|uniref:aspartate/glutamate racemase family protein n=1 Tax=Reyranella sp. TaxID=1929291 RepID=UPI00120401FD|nr:aspartate/glutamate racemase family protein [Reyranella sp.]TAJ39298.1 MAG: aspartate/glutamate racemase family protein [Reyranella sp.]
MHIGLIGGIGPAATDFYYRGLIDRHVAAGIPLDVTICHADVREMSRNLMGKNPGRQAEIFVKLVERMKAAGAKAAAITSMGGHFCVKELMAISPLPILNAIPEVDAALARRKLKKVGIIGTRTVMESRLYGGIPSVEVVPTEGEDLDRVHSNYVEMATVGHVNDAQRQVFFEAGRRLTARGAEVVMLGGTDLFLAFTGHDPGFAVIDCADIHVDAIYAKSAA